MNKYNEISAQTKQNLTDAFWEIYRNERIEKITVRQITAKAGYNRSTFYQYFTDVYDVLEQIENSVLPDMQDIPPFSRNVHDTALPVNSFMKLYANHNEYYTVLLGDNGDPAFAGKIKTRVKSLFMQQAESQNIDVLELDYSLEYMLSAMIGVLTYWFKNNENIPEQQLLSLMYSLISGEGVHELVQKLGLTT